jgi:chromosome segregation ATPase
MSTRIAGPAFMAALLCFGAAPLVAQSAEMPPQVQQWVAEVQQIQAQLEPVRQEAMQDSSLQRQHEELTRAMFEAMVAADAETEARLERMQQIMVEAAQARQQGDNDRVAALAPEAQALQAQLDAAQRQALAQPAIDQRVQAYRSALHARMAQIDAESTSLIQRMEQLDAQIREAMGGDA